jgi:hypothetical protein
MKKIIISILFIYLVCTGIFAQQSIYLSASGNDNNDGLSENTPIKTFNLAFSKLVHSNIRKITIIGTMDIGSQNVMSEDICVFGIFGEEIDSIFMNKEDEIIITGKQKAVGKDRAVLSGKGAENKVVVIVSCNNAKIRFEYIEISGGEGESGCGLIITGSSEITLGQGAVVCNNNFVGIGIQEGKCVINGGEIFANRYGGISVQENGILFLINGVIRENLGIAGAGVIVSNKGEFTMTGGVITANKASQAGGGVAVNPGGKFNQTGGYINGNIAPIRNNVSRANGTLGSNL